MVHVSPQRSICPTIAAELVSRYRRNWCGVSNQEVMSCFTLLPVACHLVAQHNGNHFVWDNWGGRSITSQPYCHNQSEFGLAVWDQAIAISLDPLNARVEIALQQMETWSKLLHPGYRLLTQTLHCDPSVGVMVGQIVTVQRTDVYHLPLTWHVHLSKDKALDVCESFCCIYARHHE